MKQADFIEELQCRIKELSIYVNKIISGYQPNPIIAEYIDRIIKWIIENIGNGMPP